MKRAFYEVVLAANLLELALQNRRSFDDLVALNQIRFEEGAVAEGELLKVKCELDEVTADYIILGHTHLPMVRRVGSRLAINPGSVGQPRDGDPRASYAVIEDGAVTLRRVAYDIDRTARDIRALGLEGPIADRLVAILKAGGA